MLLWNCKGISMKKHIITWMVLAIIVGFWSCQKEERPEEEVIPDTGVRFDLAQVPYSSLSYYRFFNGDLSNFSANARVLPYEPITPLFSDYAHKSHFIWMPSGVSATYVADGKVFNFPDGTVMIKNFYYDNVQPAGTRKIVETRLIYKKDGAWHFADYTWNEEQTEAYFSLEGSEVPIEWIDEEGVTRNVDFRIPSESECHTCHKVNDVNMPIGPKPQNINSIYDYADGSKNQIDKWLEVGYLSGEIPSTIETTVDWTDTSEPLEKRVRSYIDMNCAHCHQEGSHCSYRPMRFAYSESTTEANMGICVEPQEMITPQLTHIIARGNILRSVLHYRMNTTSQQYRMPLLGRTVVHEEAVALIEEYINSLSPSCP
jgi:uncharacterized repeat protein (TIGR03806 family)